MRDDEERHDRRRRAQHPWVDDGVRALARSWHHSALLFPLLLAPGALMLVWGRPVGILLMMAAAALPVASRLAITNYPHRFLNDGAVTTERLIIQPASRATIPRYLAMLDDEFLTVHHWNEQVKLASRVALADPVLSRFASSDLGLLHLLDQPDEVIGFVAVGETPSNGRRMMVGAHLLHEYRAKGYMTEALTAVFGELAANGVPAVHAACSLDNEAMMTAAQRAGMTRLADVHHWNHVNGDITPAALFVWQSAAHSKT